MKNTERLANLALAGLTLAPLVVKVDPNLNVILTACLAVYVGCCRSVKPTPPSFLSKSLVNAVLTCYFFVLGIIALSATILPAIKRFLPKHWNEDLIIWRFPFFRSLEIEFTRSQIVAAIPGTFFCAWYASQKHWLANNILGLAFCIQGIEMLSLGSFKTGAILLAGLFVYDIFWVFFTPVMVSVARSFDAPIKLLFPTADSARPFSMLGLGDIVIPGIFVALALRFDVSRGKGSQYFKSAFLGYTVGLVLTIVVMNWFQAAQPALLYIVPAVVGFLAAHCIWNGEVKPLLEFDESKTVVTSEEVESKDKTLKKNKGYPDKTKYHNLMEDSGEVQTEENKVSLDVNKKRTLKTPAQVMALENLYRELRFPSDEMKAQLAVQVGLTEKQISSWFCRRRLKDKRRDEYAIVRQDHSSGVIQDRGSGLRQDSCGSIKQGDYRNIDPREVESQRISGQEFPAADLTYERRSHQTQHDAHMEDTSSESSSSLHDQLFSESRDPYDMQISAKLRQNGAIMQINARSAKNMGYKPSGYLKVKGESENPAITAVKRQLGSLEIFEFSCVSLFIASAEPVYVGDPRQPHSPDISGVIKKPNLNIINAVHNSKMSAQDSYMEGANFNIVYGSERQGRKSHRQLKYNSSLDIYKGSAEKTGISDCKRSRMSSKLAVERMGSDSFSNHPVPYGGKIANEQEKPWLHDNDNHTFKAPKNENLSKTSNLIHGCSESLGTEKGPSARMEKVEKLGGEWKPKKEYPVRVKIDPTNELRVANRVNIEFPHQDFMKNASHARLLLLTNPIKGSFMDVPSSFSEDETAETSSSLD
ncbi:hypothetical protein CRYUN_Cryun25bG0063700 [Craigia yunnanensis]